MSCPCDKKTFPPSIKIMAGLDNIPHQIASFSDFRNTMFARIPMYPVFDAWRARGTDDFGIMFLEMWAYICDNLSFYDETIAHEIYIRTSRLEPSLRKLAGLLGYLPRPAVGAAVNIALFAEGRQAVNLTAGLAFRSGAFDDESPQIFELEKSYSVHPLLNGWDIDKIRSSNISSMNNDSENDDDSEDLLQSLNIDPNSNRIKTGDIVVIHSKIDDLAEVRITTDLIDEIDVNNEKYSIISFNRDISFISHCDISEVELLKPLQRASFWSMGKIGDSKDPLTLDANSASLVLDGLYRNIKVGDFLVLSKENDHRVFTIDEVNEIMQCISEGDPSDVTRPGEETYTIDPPPVKIPVTQLIIDNNINDGFNPPWYAADFNEIIIHYYFVEAAELKALEQPKINSDDITSLPLKAPIEEPSGDYAPQLFSLQDKNQSGVEVEGHIDYNQKKLVLKEDTNWNSPLIAPIRAFGNLVETSRGETVTNEVLGNGDASQKNQSFKLKKKPLTYLFNPTENNPTGLKNTLTIHVDGILWQEISTLFDASADAQIYIVRQNDDDESIITFGDGINGSRLPSGVANIVANYRYGAGAASPPAGSITQLVKPVKGIKDLKNPCAAVGGDDKELPEDIRYNAGRFSLLLGRAVSIVDMEVVAKTVPGVRTAKSEWQWDITKQKPVVCIWYIGASEILKNIVDKLKIFSDSTTPVLVKTAIGLSSSLKIQVKFDPKFITEDVIDEIKDVLLNEKYGILLSEKTGINQPIFQSRLFDTLLSIQGVIAVHDIQLKKGDNEFAEFSDFGEKPNEVGQYFDFENVEVEKMTL